MQRKLILVALGLIVLAATFAAGHLLGSSREPPRVLPSGQAAYDARDKYAIEGSPAVRDAIARWHGKVAVEGASQQEVMSGRDIQTIELPDRVCIKFAFENFDIGGEPVYCYKTVADGALRRVTTELVYDGSNVE